MHSHNIYGTPDMNFHFRRIFELLNSFSHNNYFPEYSFNQFHGLSVMTLYPYLNIYPFVILFLIIKSKIIAFYIYFIIKSFFTLIISYYSSINFSKSKKTSLLFAIIYSLSMMFLSYDFIDFDLGVSTVITILPLLIFGFIELLNNNNWVKLSLGISFVIFSHVLSIFILGSFLLLWLLINLKSINKIKINSILKAVSLSLIITSITWVPAIVFSIHNIGNVYPPFVNTLSGTSFNDLFHVGIFGSLEYSLSFFALITIFISLFFYKKFNIIIKQMYILSVFIIIICSNFMPWRIFSNWPLKALGVLQFTWRLYIIPQILLCYIFALIITKYIKSSKIINILMLISALLTIFIQLLGQEKIIKQYANAPIFNEKYVKNNVSTTQRTFHNNTIVNIRGVNLNSFGKLNLPFYKMNQSHNLSTLSNSSFNSEASDYYPMLTIPKFNFIINNKGIANNSKELLIKNISYNQFAFHTNNKINELSLPLVNYNNENVKLYLDNKSIKTYNKNGLITIKHIDIGEHNIRVENIQNIFISFIKIALFIIGCLIYFILFIKFLLYKYMI